MGSNNNAIQDGLSIVDKYVQVAINKLHLLKCKITNMQLKQISLPKTTARHLHRVCRLA